MKSLQETSSNKSVAVVNKSATPIEVASADWYRGMIEEIGSIVVETVFQAQSTMLNGKFEVGKLLNEHATKELTITQLVKYASGELHISERELWYCAKFHSEYKGLQKLPEFQSKAISWNKVKKMLADPEKAKKPCKHANTIKICICEDCGKKVEN